MGHDAIVVGSGPNGLAAAIALAQAGRSVLVVEGAEQVGGGTRTEALTLPGFRHDVCSAIHPLGAASPFFSTLPLHKYGLEWIYSPAALAHPFLDGTAITLERELSAMGAVLGADAPSYRRLLQPFLLKWDSLLHEVLAPPHFPRHPLLLARFGWHGLRSAERLVRRFHEERTRAFVGGIAGHAMLPLDRRPTASFGLLLALAGHAGGWPLARGGSQTLAAALVAYLESLGATVATGISVVRLEELPATRVVILDLTPRQIVRVAGDRLPSRYRKALERYRYGPGVFKMDWALAAPIPWRAEACRRAATVHVIGGWQELRQATSCAARREHAERPFVLLAQPSLFDSTRAPAGKHVAWAYCHVPSGSTMDMTERIESQIERFAPGFRDLILGRSSLSTGALERHNPNLVDGDINGGTQDLGQLFTRPVRRLVPYAMPLPGVYMCSASTPPGGGVHGMCGYHAAQAVLRRDLR